MRYYPIYLDLRQKLCIVVGGGSVARGRVLPLLEAGARVRVIAPRLQRPLGGIKGGNLQPELERLAAEGAIEHVARSYRAGDFEGAFLVLGERLGREVNEAMWNEANERGIPINVEDDTSHCSFIAASVMRQGDLTVAISTAGKAPALAVRLRQDLERRLGTHYARFLELAGRLRAPLAERHPEFERRRELWYRLVDSDVLELLSRGEEPRARQRIAEIMGIAPAAEATP